MTAPAPIDYHLGPVLPHVKRAAEVVGPMFGITTIGGWRSPSSSRDLNGHPAGRALDFMCTPSQGDQIAEFLLANADALGVQYVIWKQRYREPGGDWDAMEDRGSPTQNHMDHVHSNFTVRAGSGLVDTGRRSTGGTFDTTSSAGDGWADGALAIGLKIAATIAAGVLLVVGLNRTVTSGKD